MIVLPPRQYGDQAQRWALVGAELGQRRYVLLTLHRGERKTTAVLTLGQALGLAWSVFLVAIRARLGRRV